MQLSEVSGAEGGLRGWAARLSLGGAWPGLGRKESILGRGDLEMLWGKEEISGHRQGKPGKAFFFFKKMFFLC